MPALTTPVQTGPARNPWATDAARSYALRLMAARDCESLTGSALQTALDLVTGAKVYVRACSSLIDTLKEMPVVYSVDGRSPNDEDVAEGVYVWDGAYIKVQKSRQRHSLYAKRWDPENQVWVYEAGLVCRISSEMRATAEQAKAFGDQFHFCVFCSTELTDERSTTAGYGPKCADNYGLPWGDK